MIRSAFSVTVVAILVLTLPDSAKAEYRITLTGQDLFALCNGIMLDTMESDPIAVWQCIGYGQGAIDIWGKLRSFDAVVGAGFDLDFCLPRTGISGQQLTQLLREYLGALPVSSRQNDGAARFVIEALSTKYPCQ